MKNMQMWRSMSAALLLTMCGILGSRAHELAIESFDGTGQLMFNEIPTAEKYRVEWASTPNGPWRDFTETADAGLNEITASGSGTITCSVPIDHSEPTFFRIVASTSTSPAGMTQIPDGTQTGTNLDPDLGDYNLTVSAFHIDKYEVTLALWNEVRTWAVANGYSLNNGAGKADNHPVNEVNWYDAVKWCNARSEMEGYTPVYTVKGAVYRIGQEDNVVQSPVTGYRLPTNAEWEYAARGGADNHRFPWDDTDSIAHARANYNSFGEIEYDASQGAGYHPIYETGGFPYTSPVGSFEPNAYGLYDMAGNVNEWCFDHNPDPLFDSMRVLRGGSWNSPANLCRVAALFNFTPSFAMNHTGFRTVLSLEQ